MARSIVWRRPVGAGALPLRIVGAHTDSPGLRIKPNPDAITAGWRQLGVEIYGGVLLNSWLDRDLGVAGRLVLADGSQVLVDVAEPIARVPQLAIHLDRDVNERGLVLDRQAHMSPVWATSLDAPFSSWIAERAGTEEPAAWELCLYDVQPAALLGADRSLVASGRLDNLASCWAATSAIADAGVTEHVAMIALFDHEEVGSASTTGASGPILGTVIDRLHDALGISGDDVHRVLASSSCVSADNAHAVHPNYVERHDPWHAPIVNRGPAIKVNANQRYATSADTAVLFQRACDDAGVPYQTFVSRQQRAVRLDHRTAHGDAARDRHRRRGDPAALDALGTRGLRRRGSGVARDRVDGLPVRLSRAVVRAPGLRRTASAGWRATRR